MKTSILILAIAGSLQGYSQTFSRTTNGGSELGYNSITKKVDNFGNVTFIYEGAGYEKAPISFSPLANMVYSDVFQESAVKYAIGQINSKIYVGKILIMNADGRLFELTWEAEEGYPMNSKIEMKPAEL